jgi:hypothetical protein
MADLAASSVLLVRLEVPAEAAAALHDALCDVRRALTQLEDPAAASAHAVVSGAPGAEGETGKPAAAAAAKRPPSVPKPGRKAGAESKVDESASGADGSASPAAGAATAALAAACASARALLKAAVTASARTPADASGGMDDPERSAGAATPDIGSGRSEAGAGTALRSARPGKPADGPPAAAGAGGKKAVAAADAGGATGAGRDAGDESDEEDGRGSGEDSHHDGAAAAARLAAAAAGELPAESGVADALCRVFDCRLGGSVRSQAVSLWLRRVLLHG